MARVTPAIHLKHPDEVRNIAIDLTNVLDSGESATGTVTVSATPSGLTFANAQVNGSTVTINGASVAAGKALQMKVSGGTSGQKYAGEASVATNATPAQTLVIEFELQVLNR